MPRNGQLSGQGRNLHLKGISQDSHPRQQYKKTGGSTLVGRSLRIYNILPGLSLAAATCSVLLVLCLQFLIELGIRSLHVGTKPEVADAQSEDAQYTPAEENEIHQEKVHLVTVHHGHAEFDSPVIVQLGVVGQNVRSHGIGELLDDAWHNQQQ